MPKKKKFTKQAEENLANVVKTYKKLQLELRRVKKDIRHMAAFRHDGPTYSHCPSSNRPPKKKR
jgi:hypothetical protein